MKQMLIVEDDYLSQITLNRIFQDEFRIDFCDSVEEYYENFSNTNYNIIIMDISLRGNQSGLDLTQQLKEDPKRKNIPILCLTAHSFTKDERNAINAGVDEFVTKPVENRILREIVSELIKKFNSMSN